MRLWDAVKATASGVEDDGSYDSPHSPENSAARRAAAFRVRPGDLGLAADCGGRPFGVIIETSSPRGVSTLIAFANGDATLLHDDGSGIIGRQNHVHVVKQAKRLVSFAADVEPLLTPAADLAQPGAGTLRAYVLTRQALLAGEPTIADVRNDESPWSEFLGVADGLMSEFDQYLLSDAPAAGPPKPAEFLRAAAMVCVIGGLTYGAWLIPIAWIRWPLVAIGLFFTAAALFVFYLVLARSSDEPDEEALMAR